MSYITNTDIQTRLGTTLYVQLADDTGSGSADPTIVNEARLGAEGEANSYLARRYAVPVNLTAHPEVTELLVSFVLDLATYRLHARRPPIPTDVARQHDEAVRWFARVADGDVALPAATAPAENAATGTVGDASGEKRIMTRSALEKL